MLRKVSFFRAFLSLCHAVGLRCDAHKKAALLSLVLCFLGCETPEIEKRKPAPKAPESAAEPLPTKVEEPPPPPPPYQCTVPGVPIARPRACTNGRGYPACKWRLPDNFHSGGKYQIWRNTVPEHTWGRPGLVSVLLASAQAYHREYPEQKLMIGDLDAPGPRHSTHDVGRDVDLYLPSAMMVDSPGRGEYPDNYEGKSDEEIEVLRQRVETLAKILATCSKGKLRIYYNDPVVIERFTKWYEYHRFTTPFEAPMMKHNHLHRFHFHVTFPKSLPVLPLEKFDGRHPTRGVPKPPEPGDEPHLTSMNRGRAAPKDSEVGPSSKIGSSRPQGTVETESTKLVAVPAQPD